MILAFQLEGYDFARRTQHADIVRAIEVIRFDDAPVNILACKEMVSHVNPLLDASEKARRYP